MDRLLALRSNDAVTLAKITVFPLHILDVPLARCADPGAHDLAAIVAGVCIEVDCVRITFQFFPFAGVENGQGMSIS